MSMLNSAMGCEWGGLEIIYFSSLDANILII
jgi:hypothetical protein